MKMREIEIYEDDGNIIIRQPMLYEEDQIIIVHPDQVDVVIEWLEKAKSDAVV